MEQLLQELEKLEKIEHVTDLANNRRYQEVEDVLAELNYNLVNEWLGYIADGNELDVLDIPETSRLPFAILLSKSKYNDSQIFKDYLKFAKDLKKRGPAGVLIGTILIDEYINRFNSFVKLMEFAENYENYE